VTEKKPIVIGNWKMAIGYQAGGLLVRNLARILSEFTKVDIRITPPALLLAEAAKILNASGVRIGAQNVAGADYGAFTGELSVPMLREIGTNFALVGHSERRRIFGESVTLVGERAIGALRQGFEIVFCVGESKEERLAQRAEKVIAAQLEPLLAVSPEYYIDKLVLAYEPVWAIGTGVTAKPAEIVSMHQFIQKFFQERGVQPPPILYGGSISPDNFGEIIRLPGVRGGLVGGASLSVEKFAAICNASFQLAS
jgi:triosephosphate isomerase